MKPLRKILLTSGITAMLGALCCVPVLASQTEELPKTVSFETADGSGKTYSTEYELDEEAYTAKLISAEGESCNVSIPAMIEDEGVSYTVTAIAEKAVSSNIASLEVDPGLRTIHGNLFDWNQTLTEGRNVGCSGNNAEGYFRTNESRSVNAKEYIIDDVPDTDAVLNAIPDFIKNGYDENGAYYAGKCLVRVDPDCRKDLFEVKDGTVCILASAFEGCKSIKEVCIPDSVEFIGMRAFAGSTVTKVNLPSGLVGHSNRIAAYTFYDCRQLQEVEIYNGLTLSEIGSYAFMDCSSLKGFDFDQVGDNALAVMCFAGAFDPEKEIEISLRPGQFYRNYSDYYDYYTGELIRQYNDPAPAQFAKSGIKEVNFEENEGENPDTYTAVPIGCFCNCTYLDTVDLSLSVKTFDTACFDGCTNLTGDILSQDGCVVKKLNFRCLARTGLTEITLPESLESLGAAVFAEDPALETMNYKILYGMGKPAFAVLNDCTGTDMSAPYRAAVNNNVFQSIYLEKPEKNGNTFIKTLNVYPPENEYSTSISSWFYFQPYLEAVHFYNSADCGFQVPASAFDFCPSLSEVTFEHPEKVMKIEFADFRFCPSLRSFPLSDMTGLTEIGSCAFMLS